MLICVLSLGLLVGNFCCFLSGFGGVFDFFKPLILVFGAILAFFVGFWGFLGVTSISWSYPRLVTYHLLPICLPSRSPFLIMPIIVSLLAWISRATLRALIILICMTSSLRFSSSSFIPSCLICRYLL